MHSSLSVFGTTIASGKSRNAYSTYSTYLSLMWLKIPKKARNKQKISRKKQDPSLKKALSAYFWF